MYKRYYDDYHSCGCTHAENGEVITPKCADGTYRQKNNSVSALLNDCNTNDEKECIKCSTDSICDRKTAFSLPCEIDDLILIGILFLILKDNESIDPMIPLIIGFVLLTDVF